MRSCSRPGVDQALPVLADTEASRTGSLLIWNAGGARPRASHRQDACASASSAHGGERVSRPVWRELIKRRRTEIADASVLANLGNMEPGFPFQMQRGRNAGALPALSRRKSALVRGHSLGYRLGGRLAIRLGAGRRL
jgi:hypothetical protein